MLPITLSIHELVSDTESAYTGSPGVSIAGNGTPMSHNRGSRFSGASSRPIKIEPDTGSKGEDRLRAMRCAQHGAPPRVTIDGDALSVVTCCEAFKKDVLLALAEVWTTH
jgi:hypothetical protein